MPSSDATRGALSPQRAEGATEVPGKPGLADFTALRARLAQRRMGDGGPDVCRALTETLDRCLVALLPPDAGRQLAIVAVGGYGRGELCLHSDVDVMLLHGGRLPPGAVEAVLYPLWDARLTVGHAVRSVKEALTAARERAETATALLDARLVAGDASLVAELREGLGRLLRRGRLNLAGFLLAAERERRAREPDQLQEANLKDGRGGLRALQALHWQRLARTLTGVGAEPPAPVEDEAWATLLAVRNALHAVAGRRFDVYAFDLRAPAAGWLGLDVHAAGRRLYTAMRIVDRLVGEHWGEALAGPRQRRGAPSGGGSVGGRLGQGDGGMRSPPTSPSPPLSLVRGVVLRRRATQTIAAPDGGPTSPLVLAAGALARPAGRPVFTAEEAELIRSAGGPAWDRADRAAMLRLLAAGRRGWEVFTALDELGWVARALPEWRHTVAAPQHVPFHLHPLDVHLWRTVQELLAISRPESGEPWCHDVARELKTLDDALLAALLHDIGKGWPGDHAVVGAEAAAAFCRRARFGPALTGAVTRAVRHHLLLPTVATRRDIDDPRVVTHVADQAGDPRTLRILFLLAVADARATGPAVWTPWKASLVRALFARAADELARRASAEKRSPLAERLLRELERAAAGRFEPGLVREHVQAMPPSYLPSFEPQDVLRHLEAMTPPPEPGGVRVDVRPGAAATSVVVVAHDRPGLLAVLSGVFALHNVSVLDGRFFTRADGVVLDSFHVEDALGGAIDERRWARVRADMARAVRGELPLEDLLREKARAYRRPGGDGRVEVLVDTAASEGFTVVEVHCADRVGLLHDIARALFELGLDIRLAKVDTQGRDVVDTFYVRSLDGEPVRDPVRLETIRQGLTLRLAARPLP
jgi:[protein-PII] uridylyltransferase